MMLPNMTWSLLLVCLSLWPCAGRAAEARASKDPATAVVLVADPSWDDSAGYRNHIPLLREFKIIKVMSHKGPVFSFLRGHITPYRTFTYQSDRPNAIAAAQEICPQLQKIDVPIEAVIPTSDPAVR